MSGRNASPNGKATRTTRSLCDVNLVAPSLPPHCSLGAHVVLKTFNTIVALFDISITFCIGTLTYLVNALHTHRFCPPFGGKKTPAPP